MIELHHGDCLKIMPTLEENSVDTIITDPPYGIDFQSARRTASERFDKIANDKQPYTEWIGLAVSKLKQSGSLICFSRWDVAEVFRVEIDKHIPVRSQVIWDRGVHGLGDLKRQFAPQHDVIWFACFDDFRFEWKRPKSVIKSMRVDPQKLLHPNQKPVGLLRTLISHTAPKGGIVLDPFMGSASTGVACKIADREFIGIELDEHYFEIAKRRIDSMKQPELL